MQPNLVGRSLGRSQPDMLEAARVAAILNGQQGSFNLQSGLGGAGLVGGSLAGLGTAPGGLSLNLGPLPQASQQQQHLGDQLALLSQFPASLFPQYNGGADQLRNVGKTRSSDSRSSSAYASRHQAAEQRRRTRINERLELLRKLVPHAERANTAVFLEEVIKYIEALKCRTLELESALEAATGKPVAKSLAMPGPGSTPEPADSQDPSPLHPATAAPSKQLNGHSQGGVPTAPSPTLPPSAPKSSYSIPVSALEQETLAQQELQPPQPQSNLLDSPFQLQLPTLQGPTAAQLSQLQQAQAAALLSHAHSGSLSFGGGGGGAAAAAAGLSHLAAAASNGGLPHGLSSSTSQHLHHSAAIHHGLQHSNGGGGGHHHSSSASASASAHHHHAHAMAAQLSELQKLQAMHALQAQSVRPTSASTAPPPAFHPVNSKAFLHFNEDLFGGMKPELGASGRSLLAAAAAAAAAGSAAAGPTTSAATTTTQSLQLTSMHLPADSATLIGGGGVTTTVETGRKAMSGSPVSSEESGVPLKKRKVLML